MQHYIICPKSGGLFLFSNFNEATTQTLLASSALYKIIYNRGEDTQVYVNNSRTAVGKGELLFCKPLHCVQVPSPQTGLQVIAFNKDFYNLKTIDEEKDFYGFWFFRFQNTLIVSLNDVEQICFKTMFDNIEQELVYTNGSIVTQRDILKRIIRITNMKIETPENKILVANLQLDVIRRFSQLIEAHFRKKTSFEDIAKNLSKSKSFLHQLVGKYFNKQKGSKNYMMTKRAQLHNSGVQIESRSSESSMTIYMNSKLNTKGVML